MHSFSVTISCLYIRHMNIPIIYYSIWNNDVIEIEFTVKLYLFPPAHLFCVCLCACVCVCAFVYIQGVDKIMGTLKNWGIWFVFVGYIERASVGNTECSSVCLHCVVLVSVNYLLFSMTVRVKESESGRLVRFWKRTDRRCAFSWSVCDENCNFIGCIESDSF
jgi:hypothetical protein